MCIRICIYIYILYIYIYIVYIYILYIYIVYIYTVCMCTVWIHMYREREMGMINSGMIGLMSKDHFNRSCQYPLDTASKNSSPGPGSTPCAPL